MQTTGTLWPAALCCAHAAIPPPSSEQHLGRINLDVNPAKIEQLAHLLRAMISYREEDRPTAGYALTHTALQEP